VSLARERCVTCSDEAVEAEVVRVEGLTAVVRVDDAEEAVGIDLVPDAAPGDRLLCHAGIALELLPAAPEPSPVAQSHEGSSRASSVAPERRPGERSEPAAAAP
jgi:hypothetical protein